MMAEAAPTNPNSASCRLTDSRIIRFRREEQSAQTGSGEIDCGQAGDRRRTRDLTEPYTTNPRPLKVQGSQRGSRFKGEVKANPRKKKLAGKKNAKP